MPETNINDCVCCAPAAEIPQGVTIKFIEFIERLPHRESIREINYSSYGITVTYNNDFR